MIQQVLNKQLLQDVLESMRTQAKGSAGDDRRTFTGTPADEMDASEREDLLAGIASAEGFVQEEQAGDRRVGEAEFTPADRNSYIPRSPELSNLQSAIEQHFLEHQPEAVESPQVDDRRGGSVPVAGAQLTIWQDYLADRRLLGPF